MASAVAMRSKKKCFGHLGIVGREFQSVGGICIASGGGVMTLFCSQRRSRSGCVVPATRNERGGALPAACPAFLQTRVCVTFAHAKPRTVRHSSRLALFALPLERGWAGRCCRFAEWSGRCGGRPARVRQAAAKRQQRRRRAAAPRPAIGGGTARSRRALSCQPSRLVPLSRTHHLVQQQRRRRRRKNASTCTMSLARTQVSISRRR